MSIEVQLILAIDVDDEMDSQDDEDHEEFLLVKKKVKDYVTVSDMGHFFRDPTQCDPCRTLLYNKTNYFLTIE